MHHRNSMRYRAHRSFIGLLAGALGITLTAGACPTMEEFQAWVDTWYTAEANSVMLCSAVPGQNSNIYDSHVNLFTGSLFVDVPLLEAAAVPVDFDLDLYYNASLSTGVTGVGRGWRFSYDIDLIVGVPGPNNITVLWGDGRRDVFTDDGGGWSADPRLEGRRITFIFGGYDMTTKHGFVYHFDGSGRLLTMTDPSGNAATLAYDGFGNLTAISDPAGRQCTLSYNLSNQLVSIGGPLVAAPITLTYTGDLLTEIHDEGGFATMMAYNADNRLEFVTDPNGKTMSIAYWLALPVVREVRMEGALRKFAYEALTMTTSVTDSLEPGRETTTSYRMDADGLCVSVSGPLGTATNAYDPATEKLTSHTDETGRTTMWGVDPLGNVTSVTDPTFATTQFVYEPVHNFVVSITDPLSHTTTITRDGAGRATMIQDPLGNKIEYTYDPQGLVATYKDERGFVTTYGRNVYGNVTSIMDPSGFTTNIARNIRGLVTSVTDRRGFTTMYNRNIRDLVVSIQRPAGDITQMGYSASGQIASVTDAGLNVETYVRDAQERLIRLIDRSGAPTSWTRNGAGVITRITDTMGQMVQFTVDDAGRRTMRQEPDGGVWTHVLNGADLLSTMDPLGQVESYAYSPRHELIQITAGGGIVTSLTYDPDGELTSAMRTDPGEPMVGFNYVRDAAHRITSEQAIHLANRTASFGLDAASNIISISDSRRPAGFITMTYDNREDLTGVTSTTPALSITMGYDQEELLLNRSYIGVTSNFIHDQNQRLFRIDNTGVGFSSFFQMDHDGRNFMNHLMASTPSAGAFDLFVTRDAVGRPLNENYVPGTPINYTYNPVGDRLTKGAGGPPDFYAYSPGHRLLSAGTTTLAWTPRGQVTQTSAPGELTDYFYRADGTLRAITRNGQTWTVTPDPFKRIARVVQPSLLTQWHANDGGFKRSVFSAPAGQPTDEYILRAAAARGLDNARPIAWFRTPFNAGSRRAVLADGWGSGAVTDFTGALLSDRNEDLFGNKRTQSGTQRPHAEFLGMDFLPGLDGVMMANSSPGLVGSLGMGLEPGMPSPQTLYFPAFGVTGTDASLGTQGIIGAQEEREPWQDKVEWIFMSAAARQELMRQFRLFGIGGIPPKWRKHFLPDRRFEYYFLDSAHSKYYDPWHPEFTEDPMEILRRLRKMWGKAEGPDLPYDGNELYGEIRDLRSFTVDDANILNPWLTIRDYER